MRILLDHNIDHRLRKYFPGYEVSTALNEGWQSLSNGELLKAAERAGFRVLLTADSHLRMQQNLKGRSISVVVLRSVDNRLRSHVDLVPAIQGSLSEIAPGTVVEVRDPRLRDR